AIDTAVKVPSVPRNLARLVSKEIRHVQLRPENVATFIWQAVAPDFFHGFLFAAGQYSLRIWLAHSQRFQAKPVQILQQLTLPGIPYLGAGAPYIGDSQKEECSEAAFISHASREFGDHSRVGEVALLCHHGHQ